MQLVLVDYNGMSSTRHRVFLFKKEFPDKFVSCQVHYYHCQTYDLPFVQIVAVNSYLMPAIFQSTPQLCFDSIEITYPLCRGRCWAEQTLEF